MKRYLSFALAAMAVLALDAASITASQAMDVASQFINQRRLSAAPAAAKPQLRLAHEARSLGGQTDYFVFNRGADDGYVVVAGDDQVIPVWGYADNGTFDATDMPDGLRYWLEEYQRQLQWLRDHPGTQPRKPAKIEGNGVQPLLRTNWNQCKPYNDLCPNITYSSGMLAYGNHAPSGCVATATAQIMNYYRWPERGNGSHSYSCHVSGESWWQSYTTTLSANFSESVYDWDNMADIYYFVGEDYNTVYARSHDGEGAVATSAQKNSVARLMRDLGVALEMSYGSKGSGAMSEDVPKVLATYFHYAKSVFLQRDYFDDDWDACLRNELDNARPLYYSGQANDGGHAFVLDGYDTEGYFHVNWGWGGRSDGYFISSLLSPTDQGVGSFEGGYNTRQSTLANLRPQTTTRLVLSPSYLDFGTLQPGRTATLAVDLGGEMITDVVTASLSGDDTGSFTLARNTFTPDEVMHGVQIAVNYKPTGTDKDKHTATLTVQGGGWDQTLSIPITGRVNVNPLITVSADSLDFGNVELGSTTKKALTLNGVNLKSDVSLSLSGSGASSYRLSNTTLTKASMTRGVAVVVFFTPTTEGNHDALLTISGGGAAQPATVVLSGCVKPQEPSFDVTGDGHIDIDDVNALVNIILESKMPSDFPGQPDIDGSGQVDINDVNILINTILEQ